MLDKLLVGLIAIVSASANDAFKYCIIGAGPGGLQLGKLMLDAGDDFVIVERNGGAGSSFETMPAHRTLISLNKRFTGRTDPEFNLRHDWNSLLDSPSITPMTKRTKERWPHADILVDYLRDYAASPGLSDHIRYNTTVNAINRPPASSPSSSSNGFTLNIQKSGAAEATTVLDCQVLIVATGLQEANIPKDIDGIEHTIGYESLPPTGEAFEGQSVAVLGLGNAAFETGNALAPYVNFVHLWASRIPADLTGAGGNADTSSFVAWESRYVGNVRAINAGLLDSYMLKSLDGGFGALDRFIVVPCGGAAKSKRCMFERAPPITMANGTQEETVFLGYYTPGDDWSAAFVKLLEESGARAHVQGGKVKAEDSGAEVGLSGAKKDGAGPVLVAGNLHTTADRVTVLRKAITPELVDAMAEFSRRQGDPNPLIYDKIIRCLGWKHAKTMYTAGEGGVEPWMQQNGKYPVMSHEYESRNVPNLHFAGQLTHGKDFRRSAGGFIHGFRYTARALFHMLGAKHEGREWGGTKVFEDVGVWDQKSVGLGGNGCNPGDLDAHGVDGLKLPSLACKHPKSEAASTGFEGMISTMFDRINVASGPYQMVAVLGDGIVFTCPQENPTAVKAQYMPEITRDYFNARHRGRPRLFWHFGYAKQKQSLHTSRTQGTLFQVHFWYYGGDCTKGYNVPGADYASTVTHATPEVKEVLRLKETLHTNWGQYGNRFRTAGWLHAKLNEIRPGQDLPTAEEWDNSNAYNNKGGGGGGHPGDAAAAPPPPLAKGERPATMEWTELPWLASEWQGGQVDINMINKRDSTVVLYRGRHVDAEIPPQRVENVEPNAGIRMVSHELERWVAKDVQGNTLQAWTVDISNGIVQDKVFVPTDGSQGECEAGAGRCD